MTRFSSASLPNNHVHPITLCDVDHILPFSRTLDDSIANRIVCLSKWNRVKRNWTPFEAWGNNPERWTKITPQIARLPNNKQWRFAQDAMERFEDENKFLDRQLVDTQYLSRIAREYLSRLYPDQGSSPVWVVPGRLTEMLRRNWRLNELLGDHNRAVKEKDRTDHRHHAIDAAVIGATDRGLIQRIQRASREREQLGLDDVIRGIDPPWDEFRHDIKAQLDRITVSHRADHGRIDPKARARGRDSTTGQLHNDTAYGLTDDVSSTGAPMVVTRKPLETLSEKDLHKIRDNDLRQILLDLADGVSAKDLPMVFANFRARPGPYQGIRRVRLLQAQKIIPVTGPDGRAYKGYKGDSNHCYEIWRMPDGKWERIVYTTFEAHQTGTQKRPHPAAKRLMRLHKKDTIALDHPKLGPIIAVIAKLSEQRLDLVPHAEADADRRARSKDEDFDLIRVAVSTLQKAGARRVLVDELGRVRDPGPF